MIKNTKGKNINILPDQKTHTKHLIRFILSVLGARSGEPCRLTEMT